MKLEKFLNDGYIEKVNPSSKEARAKLSKAIKFFRSAQISNDDEFIEPNFINLYDAARITCLALLTLEGLRVRSNALNAHYITIASAEDLLKRKGLLNEDLRKVFKKLQKVRIKRNKFEYGSLITLSKDELKNALASTTKLIKVIDKEIKENELQQSML